jgi:hypothetical protein
MSRALEALNEALARDCISEAVEAVSPESVSLKPWRRLYHWSHGGVL